MKVLIVPDIHGNPGWKNPVLKALEEKDTHIVFLGDYVDSYNWQGNEIIKNLNEILEIKRKNATRITLLIGNHDYAYVFAKQEMSGFNLYFWHEYRHIINSNWNLFDLAWGYKGKDKYTLFSHAGLTQYFYNQIVDEIKNEDSVMHDILVLEADTHWQDLPLHELLNYFIDQCRLVWQIGASRNGRYDYGSILWADKGDLMEDRFVGIDQVVGHSVVKELMQVYIGNDRLIFGDVHTFDTLTCHYLDLE